MSQPTRTYVHAMSLEALEALPAGAEIHDDSMSAAWIAIKQPDGTWKMRARIEVQTSAAMKVAAMWAHGLAIEGPYAVVSAGLWHDTVDLWERRARCAVFDAAAAPEGWEPTLSGWWNESRALSAIYLDDAQGDVVGWVIVRDAVRGGPALGEAAEWAYDAMVES